MKRASDREAKERRRETEDECTPAIEREWKEDSGYVVNADRMYAVGLCGGGRREREVRRRT